MSQTSTNKDFKRESPLKFMNLEGKQCNKNCKVPCAFNKFALLYQIVEECFNENSCATINEILHKNIIIIIMRFEISMF